MLLFDKVGPSEYLRTFDAILGHVEYLYFSKNFIEVPGIVAFTAKHGAKKWLLGTNLAKVVEVGEEVINEMVGLIEETDGMILDSGVFGMGNLFLNVEQIGRNMIYYEDGGYRLIVNDKLFTYDSLEFHGTFLSRGKIPFLMPKSELEILKEKLRRYII